MPPQMRSTKELWPTPDGAGDEELDEELDEVLDEGRIVKLSTLASFTVCSILTLGLYLGTFVLTNSRVSRSTRVWGALDRAGLTTAVVGWDTTWPVSNPAHGIIVSNRAAWGETEAVHPREAVDMPLLLSRASEETEGRRPRLAEIARGSESGVRGRERTELAATYLEAYRHDLAKFHAAVQIAATATPDPKSEEPEAELPWCRPGREMLSAWSAASKELAEECGRRDLPRTGRYTVRIVVSGDGRLEEVTVDPENFYTTCLAQRLQGRPMPRPVDGKRCYAAYGTHWRY